MYYHITEQHPEGNRFIGCCNGSEELAQFRREWRENHNYNHSLIIREATQEEIVAWEKEISVI